MFGHQNCKENFSDLHTILEAQMILESLNSEQADGVARQITELLSLLSLKAAREPASILIDSSLQAATTEAATKYNFTPLNSFAERLKLALKEQRVTQAALAWGIGVSQSTISALVTGKSKEAGIVRARAIAEALEVNAKWLLYGECDMYSKQSESFESQAARLKFSGSNTEV